jgi:hypothetical protein
VIDFRTPNKIVLYHGVFMKFLSLTSVALLVSTVSLADTSLPTATPVTVVKSYDMKCETTAVYQIISKDGKADPKSSDKTEQIGSQTVTTTGDMSVYSTQTSDVFVDDKGQSSLGGASKINRKTKTVQLSTNQVREASDITTIYTLQKGVHYEDGSSSKTTQQHEVADYRIDADGSKVLVKDYLDGVQASLDGETNFEMINPNGTRVSVSITSSPVDSPMDDGGTVRTLQSKFICTYTPKN